MRIAKRERYKNRNTAKWELSLREKGNSQHTPFSIMKENQEMISQTTNKSMTEDETINGKT